MTALAVDGLPDGLAAGVRDPDFTGLHRIEYGLWHGQQRRPCCRRCRAAGPRLAAGAQEPDHRRPRRGSDQAADARARDPRGRAARSPVRASTTRAAAPAYPETDADVQVTRAVLGELAAADHRPRAAACCPRCRPSSRRDAGAAGHAPAGQWRPPARAPLAQRQRWTRAIGALLETLSAVPDLLEVPPSHDSADEASRRPMRALGAAATFLKGTAAGAAGTALTGGVLGGARARAPRARTGGPAVPESYPFHGATSPGSSPRARPTSSRTLLRGLRRRSPATGRPGAPAAHLTSRARFLTAGGTPADLGVGQPPSDSDVLGPDGPGRRPDRHRVGAGASLFDDRFGLAGRKPGKLTPMRVFPNDSPDPAWLHGDLLLQLCANNPDTIHHASATSPSTPAARCSCAGRCEGYGSPPRPCGTPRNLLGFKDGTANPAGRAGQSLVWVADRASRPGPRAARTRWSG